MAAIHNLLILVAATAASPGAFGHEPPARGQPKYDYGRAEETPFGRAADPRQAKRVVRVTMDDRMRFTPDRLTIRRGDVVRFVVSNTGRQMHEMVLGTPQDLAKHAEMMRKHPGMEHDEPHMVHVAPGRKGDMGWRFTRAGEFQYACLVAGHFEAGMVGTIVVTDK